MLLFFVVVLLFVAVVTPPERAANPAGRGIFFMEFSAISRLLRGTNSATAADILEEDAAFFTAAVGDPEGEAVEAVVLTLSRLAAEAETEAEALRQGGGG